MANIGPDLIMKHYSRTTAAERVDHGYELLSQENFYNYPCTYTCAHAHTHTHTHAHTHAHTHTCMHTHFTHTYTRAHTHTHTIDNRVHKRDRKSKQFLVTCNLKGQDGFMPKYRKVVFSVA